MQVGKVEADTKQFLDLDPGRLLKQAATIWNPSIGMGTLSHQTLGYLFPSGPFYWLTETLLRLPAWVSQRIWLGTIIFAAGLGMRYMLRALGIRGAGVPVAMLAYAFTPYVVQYAGIYSVFLGPWAALPWWIGFTALGMRRGGWKYPALFAITVQLVGALNATALFLCLLGPALWLIHERLVTREVSWRHVWSFTWRTGLLTFLTSLWWIVGLLVEGRYGLNLLRFTETLDTVAATAFPIEFLRGLGYWFFYGRDIVGLWNDGFRNYSTSYMIFMGLAIPAIALIAAGLLRWRHRIFFIALIVFGVTISVGAAPFRNPSVYGSVFKAFSSTSSGEALRNSGRATPLIALGVAALLGAGVSALVTKLLALDRRTLALRLAAGIGVLCLLNAAGVWGGRYYSKYLERPEQIPSYWQQAISSLNAEPHDTRVLALPGSDYATYRWGTTEDPIEPGLMDRPFVARELVPWGTPASINLLRAVDAPLQAGVFETAALAPVARLMGVGDVELRMDLQTDRWGLIPAEDLWRVFTDQPVPGLSAPQRFGTTIPGELTFPAIGDLSVPPAEDVSPPPVAVMKVADPLPIVRAKSTAAPLVIDGDGVGLVNTAATGLLDAQRTVLYSQSYQNDPQFLRGLPSDAALVVTDTNRKRGERWSRLFNNYGLTEEAGEKPLLANPLSQTLDVFPGTNDNARTVTVMRGVKSVQATTYGDRIYGFTPTQRPSRAVDGDTNTGWAIDAGFPVKNEKLLITLTKSITTDHVNLVQLLGADQDRFITNVSLQFDGGTPFAAKLDNSSRKAAGQTVTFPRRTFSSFEITINRIHDTGRLALGAKNAVGFAEVRLTDDSTQQPVRVDEAARLPTDLLDSFGAQSPDHPLAIVISPDVMDDASMQRLFSLPTSRSFSFTGSAVISRNATDAAVDARLGIPDANHGGVTASSKHTFGQPALRASSALDGDRATAWDSPVGAKPSNEFMKVQVPNRITFDHLDLALVEDGRHSVPTQIVITTDEKTKRVIDVPPATAQPDANGTTTRDVSFPALSGKTFQITVTQYTAVKSNGTLLPVGIAELGIPGVQRSAEPSTLPNACVTDLVTIDGKAFPVRVTGRTTDAALQRPLQLTPCVAGTTVNLGAGQHEIDVKVSPKTTSALDVSHIVLTSGAGGAAAGPDAVSTFSPPAGAAAPKIRIVKQGRASMTVQADASSEPFWFVLGESNNEGWVAKADGVNLGASQLVDGYANGWQVTPKSPGKPITITLDWTPQHTVWKAILISLLAGVLCLGIVAFAFARRRRLAFATESEDDELALRGLGLPSLRPTRPSVQWTTVLVSGGVAALIVRPWVGALVALVVFLALRRPRWRLALRLAPGAMVLLIAIGMAVAQQVHRYPLRFEWPTFFDWARYPAWIAVVLLGADAIIALVSRSDADDTG
jgi:arabinofuranan 3-O-arabinosyltransferase